MSRLGTGAEMDLAVHDEFVAAHGASLWHEVAVNCPTCRVEDHFAGSSSEPGGHRIGPFCLRCRGRGVVYVDGAMVQGTLSEAQYLRTVAENDWISGDLVFGPSPIPDGKQRWFSEGDRFTATWPQAVDQGQVVVRGAAQMGEAAELDHGTQPNEDLLWYEPAKALVCIGDDGQRYEEGADFLLGPGRLVRWLNSRMAAARGPRYSLKYLGFLEWIAFSPPGERVDKDARDLGPTVVLRRRTSYYTTEMPIVAAGDRIGFRARQQGPVLP